MPWQGRQRKIETQQLGLKIALLVPMGRGHLHRVPPVRRGGHTEGSSLGEPCYETFFSMDGTALASVLISAPLRPPGFAGGTPKASEKSRMYWSSTKFLYL